MQQPHTPVSFTPAILLLEDTPDVQIVLYRLLREFTRTHDIVLVTGADQVLTQVASRPVVLLIITFVLPNSTATELVKKVKQLSPGTRILLVAELMQSELGRQAHLVGVDYYLPKPFRLEELEQIVHSSIA